MEAVTVSMNSSKLKAVQSFSLHPSATPVLPTQRPWDHRPCAKVSGSPTELLSPKTGRPFVVRRAGGVSNPTRPRPPHQPLHLRSVCGASVPLHPTGLHALRVGAWSSSSCRSACGACSKLPQPRAQ